MSKRQLVTLEEIHFEEIQKIKEAHNIKTDSKAIAYAVELFNNTESLYHTKSDRVMELENELNDLRDTLEDYFAFEKKLKKFMKSDRYE